MKIFFLKLGIKIRHIENTKFTLQDGRKEVLIAQEISQQQLKLWMMGNLLKVFLSKARSSETWDVMLLEMRFSL